MNNSSFIIHNSTAVAVYHWRGARPWLLDLEPEQTGWLICLCLHREGDISLLPLAWQVDAPDEHIDNAYPHLFTTIHTEALDNEGVSLTLKTLQQDGWHINGRLTLHFTGAETEPNFHQNNRSYLWHTPKEKDEG